MLKKVVLFVFSYIRIYLMLSGVAPAIFLTYIGVSFWTHGRITFFESNGQLMFMRNQVIYSVMGMHDFFKSFIAWPAVISVVIAALSLVILLVVKIFFSRKNDEF